jgi:hypothetical protein
MKRICTLTFILIMLLVAVGLAQSAGGQTSSPQPNYSQQWYDRFDGKWLDPTKWVTFGPGCSLGFTMECVREIQNGRLRLAVRNFGATDSNWGSQFGESDLYFVSPNTINSITTDVTVSQFSGVACPANADQPTRTIVKVTGSYFNNGTGMINDDVEDDVFFWIDPSNPRSMMVANWMTGSGQGVNTLIGYYPLGTPLTVTNTWDQANHRFISVVRVKGDSGPGKRVVVPYSSLYTSDTMLPYYPYKQFTTMVFSQNCTSVRTFAQVEAFYDNVMINAAPPNQNEQ